MEEFHPKKGAQIKLLFKSKSMNYIILYFLEWVK